jgi:MoxR-like ATPase
VSTATDIAAANRRHLEREVERLRLLLHRRVLWLRARWSEPTTLEELADRALEYEDREAEQAFYREDAEASDLTRRARELAAELRSHSRARAEAGSPLPIDTLERRFGLTPFERDVVLLCLTPELDPALERLFAYVQDDASRPYVTPHLALALLAAPGADTVVAWEGLRPDAPLRRHRLVVLDGAVPGAAAGLPLRLDERVADYLFGVNRLDARVAHLVRPVAPAPLTPEHREVVDRLASTLAATEGEWPAVNLVGAAGSGRRAVARALAERLGLSLLALDAPRLPAPGPERTATLRLLEREAVLLQCAYLVPDEADDVVELLQGLVLVASSEPRQGDRASLAVHVPAPDAAGRRELWSGVLGEDGAELDGLVHQFELGPEAVARAAASARSTARLRNGDGPSAADLWNASRDQTAWKLEDLAQRIEPGYGWDDIVLPPDEAAQLAEIAAQVSHRARVYEEWGFGEKLSRGRGIGALFSGPSGTGKTMAAEILAAHLELDLYRIDLAGVVSKWVGETEANLARVFDAAERSGSILFFDEADALFGKRSEVRDSHDRYANIEVSYLLQRMEDYRGLAVLATNRKALLDDAFLRRLRFLVDFPFPDADARGRIWRGVFPERAEVGELDWEFLAGLELAGGNIRNIALNAAFLAAADDRPIAMADLLHAARREYAKIDKLLHEAEFGAYYAAVSA